MAEKPSQMNTIPDPDRNLSGESADQLRDDIENTRAAMTATIDAIQDKVDPRRVVGRARVEVSDKIRERIEPLGYAAQVKLHQAAAGVRKASAQTAEWVRHNPDDLPKAGAALLAGLGALSFGIGGIKKVRKRRRDN